MPGNIGLLVRLERVRRRLRQVDVAELAESQQAYVSALERNRPVPAQERARILTALGLWHTWKRLELKGNGEGVSPGGDGGPPSAS